jgi:diaminohydroxyphosphoribosylaminopyrimidine deaminase/5-amino-6-(5-phosphoribosylamino)uracil reductase
LAESRIRTREGRPLVTLKIAQSLDGKIATASGQSKWITGDEARRFGHLLRAKNDAILVGIETVLADDPALTCRIAGLEDRSPLRVVLDTRGRLGKGSQLAKTANRLKTLQFTANPKPALAKSGIEIVPAALDRNSRIDISAMLAELGRRGVTRLLVEGGPTIHAAFLDAGFADRVELFTAPLMLGADARDSAASMRTTALEEAPRFRRVGRRMLGPDLLESFVRKA